MANDKRNNTAARIAEQIVALLEQGVSPWHKSWRTCGSLPMSADGRPYRGVNTMLLGFSSALRGYMSPYWLTFNRAKDLGGMVRKGERGALVMYWHAKEYDKDVNGNPILDKDGNPTVKKHMVIRGYTVFNADQCDGLPEKFHPAQEERPKVADIESARAIWEGYEGRPELGRSGQCAYFPTQDKIVMPSIDDFESGEEYYSSLFHEACHSTGHRSRLNRDLGGGFGSEDYGKEELVAEIGAQFLAQTAGITRTLKNAAAYCKSWAKAIKSMPDHERAIIYAAAQAQRAADWILGNRTGRGE